MAVRFDPWQNLVNVKWGQLGNLYIQLFVWRRWHGEPYNGGNEFTNGYSGDFYPITDEFYDAKNAANEVYGPDSGYFSIGGRQSRKDLIMAGLKLSYKAWEVSQNEWGSAVVQFAYWDNEMPPYGAWSEIQPSASNPMDDPDPPFRPNGIHHVYSVASGRYAIDDMDTSDWANLAAGTGDFVDVPQFVPPT